MKRPILFTATITAALLLSSCAAGAGGGDSSAPPSVTASSSGNPLNDRYSKESIDSQASTATNHGGGSAAVERELKTLRENSLYTLDVMFRNVKKAEMDRASSSASDATFKEDFSTPYKILSPSISESEGKKIIETFANLSKNQPFDVTYIVDMEQVKISDTGDGPTATILAKDIKVRDGNDKVSSLGAEQGTITMKKGETGWEVTGASGF